MKLRKLSVQLIAGVSMIAGFSMISYAAGEWRQDSSGYRYLENGSYVQSSWLRTPQDGSWYHFDNRGYMDTGWFQDRDGKWYYLNNPNGYLITNRWIGNYYLGSDGAMLTNTTTPDGYYVGADGAWTGNLKNNSITSSDLTERQKYLIKESVEHYINAFGSGTALKPVYQLNDDDITVYMGTLIHNNHGLLTREMREVNYRQWGNEVTEANPISEVVRYTESFLGRNVPANFKDRLYDYDFGTSDTHIARVFADGEGYKTLAFNSFSLSGGKLVARGTYNDESSGGEVLSRGSIEAVFVRNDDSVMGMSLESVTLSR